MNHASLFSGIGGFDLAAEWMGWTNVFNCEWEEFPRQVLRHHFPKTKQYGDIKELDATAYAGRIDILTGGFPCQPYSFAGQRKGKQDERHLWPEMLRVVRECSPRYVVGENVRGLVGWNGGLVFEEVCADLEALGYAVQPFILPAASVGAPHRRDRVWFVAHSDHAGGGHQPAAVCGADEKVSKRDNGPKSCYANQHNASNPEFLRLEHTQKPRGLGDSKGEVRVKSSGGVEADGCVQHAADTMPRGGRQDNWHAESRQLNEKSKNNDWENFPAVAPVCGGDDGLPKELDGITFSKWRRESIKAYGNAVVPQVVHQIFKAIEKYERLDR